MTRDTQTTAFGAQGIASVPVAANDTGAVRIGGYSSPFAVQFPRLEASNDNFKRQAIATTPASSLDRGAVRIGGYSSPFAIKYPATKSANDNAAPKGVPAAAEMPSAA